MTDKDIDNEINQIDIDLEIRILAQQHKLTEDDISAIFIRSDLSKRQEVRQLQQNRTDEITSEISEREKITEKESDRLVDKSLLGSLVGFFLNKRPNAINQLIKIVGDSKMIKYDVCRVPIDSKIKKISNFFSGGKIEQSVKKNNYDDVFHLYLVITFENGQSFSIEKNEIVVVSNHKPSREGDCKSADIGHLNKSFRQVIESAENRFGKNFYRYDARTFNCQNFVLNILHETGVFGFDDFVYQDFSEAISGPLREASGFATDIKGLFGRLFQDSIKM